MAFFETRFSCPGKLFIAGEYACLVGQPAIVATLKPVFSLTASEEEINNDSLPFAEASPAGRYLLRHYDLVKNLKMTWSDPYALPIGVGSSSAQFILSVALVQKILKKAMLTPAETLKIYWDIIGNSQGLRPSGLDVLAQLEGGVGLLQTPLNELPRSEKLNPWQNQEAQFVLAFTGTKTKTHFHLGDLKARMFPQNFAREIAALGALVGKTCEAWGNGEVAKLAEYLNSFQDILSGCGFAEKLFIDNIERLRKGEGVLACKGSGAQGGDCVLILAQTEKISTIFEKIRELGWLPIQPEWSETGLHDTSI